MFAYIAASIEHMKNNDFFLSVGIVKTIELFAFDYLTSLFC